LTGQPLLLFRLKITHFSRENRPFSGKMHFFLKKTAIFFGGFKKSSTFASLLTATGS